MANVDIVTSYEELVRRHVVSTAPVDYCFCVTVSRDADLL